MSFFVQSHILVGLFYVQHKKKKKKLVELKVSKNSGYQF